MKLFLLPISSNGIEREKTTLHIKETTMKIRAALITVEFVWFGPCILCFSRQSERF